MAYKTLSYNDSAKGWTSFYGYDPEWIVNLNDSFFTFKNGQLYIHDTDENSRNTFYGEQSDSIIEYVANEGPSDVKMYRAVKLEGNTSDWDIDVETDQEKGFIDKESFTTKEGMHYSYIRNKNDEVDYSKLSVQGLGLCASSTSTTVTITDLDKGNVSIGDKLYNSVITDSTLGTPTLLGTITEIDGDEITHDGTTAASAGEFVLFAKNQTAESEGVRGYYAKVKLTSEDTTPIELYAVNAEVTKSNL